ncbi:MAG TPA: porin [Amaricoccus sp.]|uniref:porin n=1 Tax=Amaricoccus sp. TaxID=1872485 RepID=UPI002D19E022|nr:porin [Amaricoccus sp.]HMQ95350.1 porin [Amaricoccus sp.]HMR54922.1 porin [Amaricoccus sp.]HMR62244.1 porin [Amaricoccus sp.]HMU01772.1 porin [Amaricoccus sp.]
MTHRNFTRAALATGFLALPAAAIGQGLPPIEHEFSNGSVLRFYGQINKGVLQFDDGQATETYGLIDNDNSGTRVGLTYTQVRGDWTFQNVNEFQYAPFSTATANILEQSPPSSAYDWSNANIRKIDFTFDNDRMGKIWFGQGSMATDGILEMDLSGTDVIAYSGVADSAAGQLIRESDGTLSDIQIGDVYANLDGDRRFRIRYDTPTFANFTFAAAFGRNLLSSDPDVRDANVFDASVTYANTYYGTVELQAGLGYNWKEGIGSSGESNIWGGSASGIHTPTGLNLTFAAGSGDENDNSGDFWYTKLGVLRDFIGWGDTGASVDYYSGDDFNLDRDVGIDSTTSDSWGLALVQNIDRANTQLWLTYRSYDYSDNSASYDDGQAIFGGARFRF